MINAIELDSKNASPHRHLGNVYAAQEQWENALKELSAAIKLNDEYSEAYKDRAKVYRALGREELAAADEAKAKELENVPEGSE